MSRTEEVGESVRQILEDRLGKPRERPHGFGDSINGNLELLKDALSQFPRPMKRRARAACIAIENTITRLQASSPGGATAMGVLLAALIVSERLIQGQRGSRGESSLIQLVS
jgi:hypothetical protein